MSVPFIFTSGIIVVILFIIGIVYTMKEFKDMEQNPDAYRRSRSSDPKIVGKSKDSGSSS
jgi:hypothetical protein